MSRFTHEDTVVARLFEKMASKELCKHFMERIDTFEKEMKTNAYEGDPIKNLQSLLENMKEVKSSTKLINDLQSGKYRLLFTALGHAYTEMAKKTGIIDELHLDEFEKKLDEQDDEWKEELSGIMENPFAGFNPFGTDEEDKNDE